MEEKEKKSDPIYSETAYDDAFQTMEGKCDDLLIAFVNHMFGEKYTESAIIKRLSNEQYVEHEDGSEEKRVIPFYIFNYESRLSEMNNDDEKLRFHKTISGNV